MSRRNLAAFLDLALCSGTYLGMGSSGLRTHSAASETCPCGNEKAEGHEPLGFCFHRMQRAAAWSDQFDSVNWM